MQGHQGRPLQGHVKTTHDLRAFTHSNPSIPLHGFWESNMSQAPPRHRAWADVKHRDKYQQTHASVWGSTLHIAGAIQTLNCHCPGFYIPFACGGWIWMQVDSTPGAADLTVEALLHCSRWRSGTPSVPSRPKSLRR